MKVTVDTFHNVNSKAYQVPASSEWVVLALMLLFLVHIRTAHTVPYLDEIHVRQSESRLLQSASNGVGRANAHYGRVASHLMCRHDTRKGRQFVLRKGRFSCEQEAGTAEMYDEECNIGHRQQRKRDTEVCTGNYYPPLGLQRGE